MNELTTKNVEEAIEKLIGASPDSFLLVVRTKGQTALCASGNYVDNAINIAFLSDYVQDLRKNKTNHVELDMDEK